MNDRTRQRSRIFILSSFAIFVAAVSIRFGSAAAKPAAATPPRISASTTVEELWLIWQGDETIEVGVSKQRGLFHAPLRIKVNNRSIALGGLYVHINGLTEGFAVASTNAELREGRIEVTHVLRHPRLSEPTT